jgi:hypothetical protein
MTDDLGKLERRLEQATAPRCEAGDELDPEAASLRAGWLALGDLLVAAQSQVEPPMCSVPFVPASRRQRWMLLRFAALAASLLIAVSVISYLRGRKPTASNLADTQPTANPMQHEPAVAQNPRTPDSSEVEKTPAAASMAEFAWNDSFDQELESAGWAIRQAQSDQFAFASKSDQMQYQLENLRKEFEDSSL